MVDRLLHGVDRARRVAELHRRPERLVLALEVLQAMAEIGRLVRRALGIDQDRQIAAKPHRIHVVEEEGAVAAEQILHVVLGGRDQHVDAGLVHQTVEPRGVERGGGLRLSGYVEHRRGSLCAGHAFLRKAALSGPIARIDPVEHAQIGRPIGRAAAAVVLVVLGDRLAADLRRDLDQLAAGRLHHELDFGGFHQMLHQDEGLARGLADREHAVIVHDHGAVVAKMRNEPLALAEVLGDALVRVIAERAVEAHRLLRNHPQPALEAGDRHPGRGVHVHRAVHVRPAAQHAAVERKARPVDAGGLVEVVVHVDLDQVGGGDLGPQQLVLLHQELARLARHPHGAVVVDDVVPAVMGDQPVGRGQIDARLPLVGRHACGYVG